MNSIGISLLAGSVLLIVVNEAVRGKYGWLSNRHFVVFWIVLVLAIAGMFVSLGIAIRDALDKTSASPKSMLYGWSLDAPSTSISVTLICLLVIIINEIVRLTRGGGLYYVVVWASAFWGSSLALGLSLKNVFAWLSA